MTTTNEEQELANEINLRAILADVRTLKQRLCMVDLGPKAVREMTAAKTGLTVAESALESLLQ